MSYTKLFGSILHSTLWREDAPTRIVWITMLAMADRDGIVEASVPGLADAARVTLDECLAALEKFKSPDKWSGSQEHEGRRIADVSGGWRLLNYDLYRMKQDREEALEKSAERVRRHRERRAQMAKPNERPLRDVTPGNAPSRDVADETRGNPIASPSASPPERSLSSGSGPDKRQHQVQVVFDHWNRRIGKGRKRLTPDRVRKIRTRLVEGFTVEQLKVAIDGVTRDDWHMGRDPKTRGRPYNDFKTIFKSASKVEEFIEVAEGSRNGNSSSNNPIRSTGSHQKNHGKTGFESLGIPEKDL